VERERGCIQIIKENLSRCGFQHKARVVQDDVVRVLSSLLGAGEFHVAFVGPPYFRGLQNVTLQVLDSASPRPVLIVVQHSSQEQVRVDWKHLEHARSCSYGDTCLTFFTVSDEPAAQ
jgi:16S rRNA G966 N2-methylase RsmD